MLVEAQRWYAKQKKTVQKNAIGECGCGKKEFNLPKPQKLQSHSALYLFYCV